MNDPGSSAGDSASVFEFPCRFPVKAMGLNEIDFSAHLLRLLAEHSESIDHDSMQMQTSSSGRYLSVTMIIEAHSKAQLDAIYTLLSDDARVLVAL